LEETKKVNKFISEWEINTSGEVIELPLHKCGKYNFTVDWGDDTSNKIKNYSSEKKFHKYKSPGIYTIQLTGRIECLSFENNFSKTNLLKILNWGNVNLNFDFACNKMFSGCSSLEIIAVDSPVIGKNTNFEKCFERCSSLKSGVGHWDVSNVKMFREMFSNAVNFNENLENWNTKCAEDISGMFENCKNFSSILKNWNVSSVKDFSRFAVGTDKFVGQIHTWNIQSATDMGNMFFNSKLSDHDYSLLIQSWSNLNLPKITDNLKKFNPGNSFYYLNDEYARKRLVSTIGVHDMGTNSKFSSDEDAYVTLVEVGSKYDKSCDNLNDIRLWKTNNTNQQYNILELPIKKTNKLYDFFCEHFYFRKKLHNKLLKFNAYINSKETNFGNNWKCRTGLYSIIDKHEATLDMLTKFSDINVDNTNILNISDYYVTDISYKQPMFFPDVCSTFSLYKTKSTKSSELVCENKFLISDYRYPKTVLTNFTYEAKIGCDPALKYNSNECGCLLYRNNKSKNFIIFSAITESEECTKLSLYVSFKKNNTWTHPIKFDEHLNNEQESYSYTMRGILLESAFGVTFSDMNNLLCVTKTTSSKTYIDTFKYINSSFSKVNSISFDGQIKSACVVRPNMDLIVPGLNSSIVKYDAEKQRYITDELLGVSELFDKVNLKSFVISNGTRFIGVSVDFEEVDNYYKALVVEVGVVGVGFDGNHIQTNTDSINIPLNLRDGENQYHHIFGSNEITKKNTAYQVSSYNNVYCVFFYDADQELPTNHSSLVCPFILGTDSEIKSYVSKSSAIINSFVASDYVVQIVIRNPYDQHSNITSYICDNLEIDIFQINNNDGLSIETKKSIQVQSLLGRDVLIANIKRYMDEQVITEFYYTKDLAKLVNIICDPTCKELNLLVY
jgi:hypothetical protein